MQLTEKELNYILSEAIQSTLLENEPNIETQIKTKRGNRLRNNTAPEEEKLEWGKGRGEQIYDKLSGFGNQIWRGIKKNIVPSMGAVASTMGAFSGSNGLLSGGLIYGGIAIMAASIGSSLMKKHQFNSKKIPNNVNKAFDLAIKAVPEYKKAANLCKRIQQNWNNACLAYNEIAKEKQWVPQTIEWKSQEIQSQIRQDFVLSSGALNGTKGRTRINQNFSNLNISEAKQGNLDFQNIDLSTYQIVEFLSQYDNANAIKAIGQIAQLYVESYKIYFEWKTYLNAIGKKFNISWDEMNSGKLTGNKMRRNNIAVNTNKLSNIGELVNLTVVNANYTYNRQTIILLQDTKTHNYYGIRKGIIGGEKVYNYINNGGKTFNLELFPNLLEPTKTNYPIMVNNQYPVYILNTNGVKELEFQQQGNQQGQGQTQNQPQGQTQNQPQGQTQQSNPYGNYGGGWSSSSTF